MAFLVKKESVDIVETANTFEIDETLRISAKDYKTSSVRVIIANAKKDGLIDSSKVFRILRDKQNNTTIITRIV